MLVTQLHKRLTIGIMRSADMIESIFLEQHDTLLYSPRIGCRAKGSESMMIGDTLEQHLLSIKLKSELG